ncbi:uncharacterized protein LOC117600418 [Osmia lignaria lignaria]|uniref:uncharacterized protein LOC117600418 n=1 Tax=Osmia lignaria lignaria TaxID=1437193 RepID=UPI00402B6C65
MAVASNAMYNAKTVVPSFLSSNMYYGYVPLYRKENQLNVTFENTDITKSPVLDRCSYDTAMETDDDGYDYSMASRYVNNDSVIPEASAQNRLKDNEKQQQRQQQTNHGVDMLRRRNRKRCNSDLNPTSELKKFRAGSGNNNHIHCGTRSIKDYGSTMMFDDSRALHVNTINNNNLEQSMIVNNCCWAAGSHNLLNNSDYKHLLSNNGHKSVENNVEYEKILFETHGCSVYQFHRLQLTDNDCTETEF